MRLYLFSINAVHRMPSGENELMFNFTEQKEHSRIHKPGSEASVVITDAVPLIFSPFMPIDHVIHFLRQAANHLEDQMKELDGTSPEKEIPCSDNGD